MCPIYPDLEKNGDATLLDLVPQSLPGKILDFTGPGESDILENFDFDSFLHNTDDQNFNFDSFTTLDFGTVDTGIPVTTPNTNVCFPQPQLQMIPVEMENLQQFCIVLGQNYLRKIVTIHNACKRVAGLDYPDVLQNQLLTASRTLTKLADLIVQHHATIVETGVLGALEGMVLECQYACDRLTQNLLLVDDSSSSDNTVVIGLYKTYIKNSELIAYDCLVPLSKTLRAFTWYVHARLVRLLS
jgi:hypothetical protein